MLYIVLMLHPRLKIMPFKLTGCCRMRSKDRKFKPRRRRMQNVWLYSTKWSHLNKDKRDCRTFQLIKQVAHSWRHLKRGLLMQYVWSRVLPRKNCQSDAHLPYLLLPSPTSPPPCSNLPSPMLQALQCHTSTLQFL